MVLKVVKPAETGTIGSSPKLRAAVFGPSAVRRSSAQRCLARRQFAEAPRSNVWSVGGSPKLRVRLHGGLKKTLKLRASLREGFKKTLEGYASLQGGFKKTLKLRANTRGIKK